MLCIITFSRGICPTVCERISAFVCMLCARASSLRSVCSTVYSANTSRMSRRWRTGGLFLISLLVAFAVRRHGTKQGSAWTPLTVALTQLTFRLPAPGKSNGDVFSRSRGWSGPLTSTPLSQSFGHSAMEGRSRGGDGDRSRMLIWQPGSPVPVAKRQGFRFRCVTRGILCLPPAPQICISTPLYLS